MLGHAVCSWAQKEGKTGPVKIWHCLCHVEVRIPTLATLRQSIFHFTNEENGSFQKSSAPPQVTQALRDKAWLEEQAKDCVVTIASVLHEDSHALPPLRTHSSPPDLHISPSTDVLTWVSHRHLSLCMTWAQVTISPHIPAQPPSPSEFPFGKWIHWPNQKTRPYPRIVSSQNVFSSEEPKTQLKMA